MGDRDLLSTTSSSAALSSLPAQPSLPPSGGLHAGRHSPAGSVLSPTACLVPIHNGEASLKCPSLRGTHIILHFLMRARKFLRRNPSWRPKTQWLVFNDSTELHSSTCLNRDGGLSVFRDGGDPRVHGTFSKDRGVSFDFDFEILPSATDIMKFLQTAYKNAQLEFDSLICALVLIERLLEKGVMHGGMVITSQNCGRFCLRAWC